ncbi:diacylglycerol/lipid kinase family protein [Geoalkalibacter halelectricus]|uniref:Diacylglycerol kinase family lipid kinase n=1 Tax=Geoalkalibacter halelectricus TaxID=2847045 RepID=A0ABY5ZI30_9BACT|nr:diacylglycerol kinase family protein [Geoalkalibacter halelectricus]MDO3378993.1 diacylglycerol kinase family lipid kinase [Geoalkalibacter halelectricus]UWZ78807.1 diacylglycerol kinase family lipid kinase [Geoalkalibacter halelectricus]
MELHNRNIIVIANPTAGRRGPQRIEQAVTALRRRGACVDLWYTQRRGDGLDLCRQAIERRPDAVVAAGGDGTINEVINGLAGSDIPLGILPLGTANVFAREIGLGKDIADAVETIFAGRTQRVHLGLAGDRHFLLMAGIGFDAQVVYQLDLGLKRLLGKAAYVLTGVRVLLAPPSQLLEIEADGEILTGYGVIIGKARHYGGAFQATPLAGLDLPELDLCIFRRRGALPLMRYVSGIARGRHLQLPDVLYRKVTSARVRCASPLPVQADGDLIGRLPMDFSVARDSLTILRPA